MKDLGKQSQKIAEILNSYNLTEWGFAELSSAPSQSPPSSLDRYEKWIDDSRHGEMSYLERHFEIKQNPQIKYQNMKSAICFREHYYPLANKSKSPLPGLRIALYAQSIDYHDRLKEKFAPIIQELQTNFPNEEFIFHTDSGPILERDLAYRAGLGWFGKNSCLIDQKTGSLFFICEILTSLNLPQAKLLHPDRCGTCTKCIDICPTEAILDDRTLDATKCIPYLNIESKKLPDIQLLSKMNDWFFGCDLCQTVCPWNSKVYGRESMDLLSKKHQVILEETISDLRWVLLSNDSEIRSKLKAWPMIRAKSFGLKRNALVVTGNLKLQQLQPEVQICQKDKDLAELASWVLEQLQD